MKKKNTRKIYSMTNFKQNEGKKKEGVCDGFRILILRSRVVEDSPCLVRVCAILKSC